MSKICTFCGSEVEDNAKFCMFCGSPVKEVNDTQEVKDENTEQINQEDYFDLGQEPKFDEDIFESNNTNDSFDNQETYNSINNNQNNNQTGFAIASLVLGILSLVCCCTFYVGILFAIASIVFGAITIKNNYNGKGMAIAGMICSGISLLIYIIIAIFAGAVAFFDAPLSDNIGDSISDFIDSI